MLTQHPMVLFAELAIPGVLLLGVAYLLRLLSIPGQHQDYGYLFTLNWSVMTTVGLPSIFAIAAHLNRSALASIERLCSADWKVVRTTQGYIASGYPKHLSDKLAARDRA